MVIHPDGTAHYYVCGDVSPEKKAKIEVQRACMKESEFYVAFLERLEKL